jgi:glycosyltransferase involved in cell wall biosynthesis
MKVIHLATTLERSLGGISRSVPRLAGALAEAGVDVVLVAARAKEPTFTREDLPGVDLRLGRDQREVRKLLEGALAEAGPGALIHHAGIWTSLNHDAATLGRRSEVPAICSPRSMLDPWALQHRWMKKRVAWWVYARRDLRNAACIHATAELEAENIRRVLPEAPIAVVPNGIDAPPWKERPQGEEGAPRRLLFLSRLHPKKGLEDLIRAFGRLAPQGWVLSIAGNDEENYRSRLERLAAELNGAARVEFLGPVGDRDKWDVYRSADLFVLPSYSENFGLVVGEALAVGTPVITTQAAPWQELQQERCGWWVPTGEEALLGALREALAVDRGELLEMGIRGRRLITARYSWASVARKMIAVYEDVLARNQQQRGAAQKRG